MSAEILPVTSYLDKKGIFKGYKKHIEKLGVKARGEVLIIGPGQQEVAVIESAISKGEVGGITLIGENPTFLEPVLTICRQNYRVPIVANALSFGTFFDVNPSRTFDTILYFGRPGNQHLEDLLKELATRLNSSGTAYLTINGQCPSFTPIIPESQLKIIRRIPPNPNYDTIPEYYGVVLHKT